MYRSRPTFPAIWERGRETARGMTETQDILCEKQGRCGLVTLNRPRALNALTYDMIAAMERHYTDWAADPDVYGVVLQSAGGRAFCSGGDLKALYEWWRKDRLDELLRLYGGEYQHNWSLERFTKPHVSLIDGLMYGGGAGIALYGTHRIAGGNFRFAMPEVGIGFFPDVGATHFLPRLKGETGMYLALTGRAIGQADAWYLGLVTHCIPESEYDAIREAMIEADPIDPVLDGLHREPESPELAGIQPAIDLHFSGSSVEEILDNLDRENGDNAAWARAVAGDIRTRSPLALKVAFRQVRTGGALGLDEALKLEYRIARRFLTGTEFYEGIRAAIVDKDGKPRWSPATLEEVSGDMVEACFAPLEEGDLDLVNPFL